MLRIVAYAALVLVALLGVLQELLYLPHLPEEVASHFGANGQPDGFTSKWSYLSMMISMKIGMMLMLGLLGYFIRYMPASMINIPHRDYWMHPDRRAATMRDTELTLLAIGIGTGLFLNGISHLTYLANAGGTRLPMVPFAIMMAAFLAFVAVICVRSFRRYGRVPG